MTEPQRELPQYTTNPDEFQENMRKIGNVTERIAAGEESLVRALEDVLPEVSLLRMYLMQGIVKGDIAPDYAEIALKSVHLEVQIRHAIGSRGLSWGR